MQSGALHSLFGEGEGGGGGQKINGVLGSIQTLSPEQFKATYATSH